MGASSRHRTTEEAGIGGIRCDERGLELRSHLVSGLADARSNRGPYPIGSRTMPEHFSYRCLQDARKSASPAGMGRGNDEREN